MKNEIVDFIEFTYVNIVDIVFIYYFQPPQIDYPEKISRVVNGPNHKEQVFLNPLSYCF